MRLRSLPPSVPAALFLALGVFAVIAAPLHAAPVYHPQKGTEILWDTYGIPHIYAKSTPDLFFSYGYAQAEAHGNLLLHVYGASRGRAAEYFDSADSAANIRSDTWVWTNSIPQRSETWFQQQTPEFRGYLEAFAAGINAYAAGHPEALSEEARRVLPVTALDPIEHSQHFVHFTFVASARLAEPARPAAATAQADLNAGPLVETPGVPADSDSGSNGWAIAPSHSTSGKAMLLSNPHLAWAGVQTYFEAELNAPGIHIYGATQVGLPVLRFAFNDYLGYTHTVNTIDAADLYRIKTSGTGYLLDGKLQQFETEPHTLKVRRPDNTFTTQTLEVRRTVHGPIIKQDGGDPIALRVAGLDKPFMLEQYWQMSTAHNFGEFESALKRLQAPMYNVLYADRDGHIEYLFGGDVPRRSQGDVAFWAGIVPGDTSATLWHDYLTYDELPKVIDPPNGYVQNTNEPPWDAAWPNNLDPAKYPPYVAPTFTTFRTERSLRMLANTYSDPDIDPVPFDRVYGAPRKILSAVLPPQLTHQVELRFTDEARKAKVRGSILLNLWVDPNGDPTHIRVIRGAGLGLNERALEAVRQYKFRPATENGKPVLVELNIEVNFQIFDRKPSKAELAKAQVPYSKPNLVSFDQMIEKKLSTRMELADRILPELLAAADKYGTPQAKAAAAVLSKWDRQAEANSRGAVLFYAWARQFMGPALSSQTGFRAPFSLADPMSTPGGLKDPAKAALQLDAAAAETVRDFGALDVPWGDVMRFQLNNQSTGLLTGTNALRSAPIDNVSLPGNGGYGNLGIFRVVTYGPLDAATKTRTPIHGDGYVAAIEFSNPVHASISLSYGNSSQPNSRFHTNQLPLLEHKQMREALLTREAVEAHLATRESF